MDVLAALVADYQPAETIEPGERPFDNQRWRPSFSLLSPPFREMRSKMPRWRHAFRQRG